MKTLKTILQVSLILMLFISCSKDDEPNLNPTIASISPTSGSKTTIVSITGNDFGSDISRTQVFFNEVEATVQSVSNTQIIAVVPARAFTGLVKVMLNGTELIGPEFTYTISEIQVTTIAGSTRGFADGTGSAAQFRYTSGVALDSENNIYVADASNHKIRKITPSGVVSTFAGSTQGFAEGTGSAAQFDLPLGIALDSKNNIYVADTSNDRIRKITPSGVVSTLAGSTQGFADGVGSVAKFNQPYGIAIDSENNIYVADTRNHKIRKITPSGVVSTLAGSNDGFVDGEGSAAQFKYPVGIALDSDDFIYVADYNFKIRKITPLGVVSTLEPTFVFGEGSIGVATDSENNVYVTDSGNHRIRKITPSGAVSTLAGSTEGFADGAGSTAQFKYPVGVAIDSENNVYVSDSGNNKIRKITQE